MVTSEDEVPKKPRARQRVTLKLSEPEPIAGPSLVVESSSEAASDPTSRSLLLTLPDLKLLEQRVSQAGASELRELRKELRLADVRAASDLLIMQTEVEEWQAVAKVLLGKIGDSLARE